MEIFWSKVDGGHCRWILVWISAVCGILEDEVDGSLVRENELFNGVDVGIGREDCDEPGLGSGLSEFRDMRFCICWGKAVGRGRAKDVMAGVVGLSSLDGTGGGRGLSTSNWEVGLSKLFPPLS